MLLGVDALNRIQFRAIAAMVVYFGEKVVGGGLTSAIGQLAALRAARG